MATTTLFLHRFERQTHIVIPGTVHGFQGLEPTHITCCDPLGRALEALRHDTTVITIDPASQDVTIFFVIPESGMVFLRAPA